jgi:HEAT repeat protein
VKGRYTPAFAARGLGRAKDSGAAEVLLPLLDPAAQPREVVGSTIIALRDLSLMAAGARLGALAADPDVDGTLRMEALTTIAAMKAIDQLPIVQDLITDDWPALRAAAIRAAAAIDPDTFTLILSGLEVDRHWVGRAALAEALGAQPAETALPRLMTLLKDEDKRVVPHVLRSLVRQKAPEAESILYTHLKEADYVIRETAAELIGQTKPAGGLAALREAYAAGQPDAAYSARAASVSAMAAYGADGADGVRAALADKDWAVRVRAAELLTKLDPSGDHRSAIRPVPGSPIAPYDDPQLIAPATSPHVFIDTEPRHDRVRAGRARRPADLAQLHRPGTEGIFQRPAGAPRGGQLRDAGRRPARRRRRRAGLHHPRRAQRAALPARHGRHGAVVERTPAAASSSSRIRRSRTSTGSTPRSATS